MVSASPGVESGSCTKLKTKAERLERLNGGLSARKLFCCERLLTRQVTRRGAGRKALRLAV
jgi:hypothetical protein